MAKNATNPGLNELDQLCVDSIRFLSMDGVQAANSGHPGMPMGMAPAAYKLWIEHLRISPENPKWPNRDRFVLSAGHGSMLIYSLLHLAGYDLSLDELKNFRQLGSLTPGHPEYGMTPGVEVTTGPLGQGISNAVGMAIAEKYLAHRYNKDDITLFDYNIYVIAGDGCLQEGVSGEASSLAGHLGLDNLIVIYDDNKITIDGETELSFSEDVAKRYEGYGWNVIEVSGDGNDMETFNKALEQAKAENDRPTIIKLRTHIGFGSPNFQDTHTAHGAPLGDDEIAAIKKNFGWDPEKKFHVPDDVYKQMGKIKQNGKKLHDQWAQLFQQYKQKYPELFAELKNALDKKPLADIDSLMPEFKPGDKIATRKASGAVIQALMPSLPNVLGGSADLTPSNNTKFKEAQDFQRDNRGGRYIRYGVREHAMGSIMNGIAVSDILIPYGGTFLTFSDYMRPAVRVAALSHYPTVFVYTHDSIGLGEDGPTHQPVEHFAALRCIPNLLFFRPADAYETACTWKYILEHRDGPAAMALTRQGLPVMDPAKYDIAKGFEKGAYILVKQDNPDIILLATGSEVSLAIQAGEKLAADGIKAQVVSMPCWELFEKQDQAYKNQVIPPTVKNRIGIEAGVRQGWDRWLGDCGVFIGMHSFGTSAPAGKCFEHFGITTDAIIETAKKIC